MVWVLVFGGFFESHCELKGLNKYDVTDAQIISSLSFLGWLPGLFDPVVLVPESLIVDQETRVSSGL